MLRIAFLVFLLSATGAPAANALDLELYAALLERSTAAVDDPASTRVDYRSLQGSRDWAALVQSLRDADPERLASKPEKLAFWINAYNVLAIDLVRAHHPVDSIRSIGGFFSPVWRMEAGRIAGRAYTLHEIEHEILRPMGDPRIHAAIVCASVSCPPLRREPYRAEQLEAQLDDNVRRWLADPRKGVRVDRVARVVELSPILDWFAEDFDDDALAFVARYVDPADAQWIRERRAALEVRYFTYDWSLNDLDRREVP